MPYLSTADQKEYDKLYQEVANLGAPYNAEAKKIMHDFDDIERDYPTRSEVDTLFRDLRSAIAKGKEIKSQSKDVIKDTEINSEPSDPVETEEEVEEDKGYVLDVNDFRLPSASEEINRLLKTIGSMVEDLCEIGGPQAEILINRLMETVDDIKSSDAFVLARHKLDIKNKLNQIKSEIDELIMQKLDIIDSKRIEPQPGEE